VNNALVIVGLNELRATLQKLPDELLGEATAIVHAQAEAAHREISAAYPVHTGNLRSQLRIELGTDGRSATARVRNTAKHAYLFEAGSGPRRRASGGNTGRMPAGRVFIPIAMQRRRIMLAALIDLVRRSGLHVSGAAA